MKDEPNHPCHNILPKPIGHHYNLWKTDDSRGHTVSPGLRDIRHPCHNILPKSIDHNYNLRKTDDSRGPTVFSRTERHTSSLSQYLA